MAEVISLLILFLIALPKVKVSINNANSLTADFSTNVKGFLCILIFYSDVRKNRQQNSEVPRQHIV